MNPMRDRGGSSDDLIGEINVTPFVDVMLVLLIIFMVAAPMMTVGVPVDLPRAALAELPAEEQPLEVFIKADGALFIGEEPVSDGELGARFAALPAESRNQRVRLRADRAVEYERVITVFEALTAAGFSRIGLVAQPRSEPAP
jgi:biopolymer transport protein TolR